MGKRNIISIASSAPSILIRASRFCTHVVFQFTSPPHFKKTPDYEKTRSGVRLQKMSFHPTLLSVPEFRWLQPLITQVMDYHHR